MATLKAGTSKPATSPITSRRKRDPCTAIAPVFAALGDRTRLLLLSRLGDGRPQSIIQLTQDTGLTRQGVSKHLSLMEQARIISSERIGRECRYVIRPEALSEARDYLERASRQWDEAIERLRQLVEE